MNLKPGGQQPRMCDTIWQGRALGLVYRDGTPKGLAVILRERGIDTRVKLLCDLKAVIARLSSRKDKAGTLLERSWTCLPFGAGPKQNATPGHTLRPHQLDVLFREYGGSIFGRSDL